MCRYAGVLYKDHFACFACRKVFRHSQWFSKNLGPWERREHYKVEREFRCPECKQPLYDFGMDFKAPRREDVAAWRILERMAGLGFRFQGCGCDAGGLVPPKTMDEFPRWLERNARHSAGETLLHRYAQRNGKAPTGAH